MVLASTQPSQSRSHSLHGLNAMEKHKHLLYHVLVMLHANATGDDVIALDLSVCADFPLSLQRGEIAHGRHLGRDRFCSV